jgi:hypothetical protein
MLRSDTSTLRFRGPRSPLLFLLIPFLLGALVAAFLSWLILRPSPEDPVAVDYVPGLASVDGKGKQITLYDPSGQILGRLEVTKLTEGRRCLRRAEGRFEVLAGVVHIEPDETFPQPRNVLVSVRCAGRGEAPNGEPTGGGGDGAGGGGGGNGGGGR